jgi:hypothetical protein
MHLILFVLPETFNRKLCIHVTTAASLRNWFELWLELVRHDGASCNTRVITTAIESPPLDFPMFIPELGCLVL